MFFKAVHGLGTKRSQKEVSPSLPEKQNVPQLQKYSAGTRPWDKAGGGAVSPKTFSAPWASVWSKNKGGPGGLSPASATEITLWVSDNRLNKRVGLAELDRY